MLPGRFLSLAGGSEEDGGLDHEAICLGVEDIGNGVRFTC